jgi:replicative DNA helicase
MLDSHVRIFKAIRTLHQAKAGIDFQTVCAQLRTSAELDTVGGMGYVIQLESDVPRKPDTAGYIRTLKTKALARRLASLAYDDQQRASDPSQDPQALLEDAIEARKGLLDSGSDADLQSVGDWLNQQGDEEASFAQMATTDGIPSGFPGLDEITGGFQRGQLIVVAARPSMGKTAWACNIAQSIASRGYVTALFSLEQPKKDMVRRMIASAGGIEYRAIRERRLDEVSRRLFIERRSALMTDPLYIEDTQGLTATRIVRKCERLKRIQGLDIALIDQLSHVNTGDCKERDLRLKIGEQTKRFKYMAKELDIPVVVFNQLRRVS